MPRYVFAINSNDNAAVHLCHHSRQTEQILIAGQLHCVQVHAVIGDVILSPDLSSECDEQHVYAAQEGCWKDDMDIVGKIRRIWLQLLSGLLRHAVQVPA